MDPQIVRHRLRQLLLDRLGQDLVEYALMGAFVAVAAGAIFPSSLMPAISTIFSNIDSYMALAGS
jgi:Flp pilus assembly pilin Flp